MFQALTHSCRRRAGTPSLFRPKRGAVRKVWPTPDSFSHPISPLALHSRRGTGATHWAYAAAFRRRPPSRRRILILRRQTSFPPRPPARRHCPSGPEQHFLLPARLVPGHQRVHQSDSLDHQPVPPLKFSGSASACPPAPRLTHPGFYGKLLVPRLRFRAVRLCSHRETLDRLLLRPRKKTTSGLRIFPPPPSEQVHGSTVRTKFLHHRAH